MPFWDKKASEVPDWARPLSPEKYALFVTTVGETLDAIHSSDQRDSIRDGVLRLRNSAGSVESFGLQNLAQLLAMEPTGKWPRLVAEHFETMLKVDELPQSGAEITQALATRHLHALSDRHVGAADAGDATRCFRRDAESPGGGRQG